MRIAMVALGYGFLVLGVLGLVLPILQGFLFIAVGLLILGRYAPWASRLLDRACATHPRVASVIEKAESVVARVEERLAALWQRLFPSSTG
jgi:uncharacterized membrane protein YbaN (DUF454 family)